MDNNIPAFPIHPDTTPASTSLHCGMTLLDHFAGQALPAIITSVNFMDKFIEAVASEDKNITFGKMAATAAYDYAAAMLEARKTYIK